jgi:hypothetical protein
MQAIITKFIGPTNRHGTRIRASLKNNFSSKTESITIPYDSAHSERNNHANAAMALVRKLISADVPNHWECGELPNGGYCFVMQGEEFTRYFRL